MKRDTRQDTDSRAKQGGQGTRRIVGSVAYRAESDDQARSDDGQQAQTGGEGMPANNTPLSLTMHTDVGICGGSGLSMVERLEQGKRMIGLPVQDLEKKTAPEGVTTPAIPDFGDSPNDVHVGDGPYDPKAGDAPGDPIATAIEKNRVWHGEKKTAPGSQGAPYNVLAMARHLKIKPSVMIKAAESSLAWRDTYGTLVICDEHLGMMAKVLEMNLNVLKKAAKTAVAVKLGDGEEYVRVVSIPVNNRLLGCMRLSCDHYGERVVVKVSDVLNYKMSDEFVARSSRNGMEAVYGN